MFGLETSSELQKYRRNLLFLFGPLGSVKVKKIHHVKTRAEGTSGIKSDFLSPPPAVSNDEMQDVPREFSST